MIHRFADVEEGAVVHPTAKVWRWTHVRSGAIIEDRVIIGQCCYIDTDVKIPRGCKIQNGVSIYAGVELDEHVFVGPNVTFCNDLYPRSKIRLGNFRRTKICRNASIGAGAVVLCGITIGENSMVGAGSVVVDDVPNNTIAVGNPAKVIGKVHDPVC